MDKFEKSKKLQEILCQREFFQEVSILPENKKFFIKKINKDEFQEIFDYALNSVRYFHVKSTPCFISLLNPNSNDHVVWFWKIKNECAEKVFNFGFEINCDLIDFYVLDVAETYALLEIIEEPSYPQALKDVILFNLEIFG